MLMKWPSVTFARDCQVEALPRCGEVTGQSGECLRSPQIAQQVVIAGSHTNGPFN